jgi:hypothetical protein
MLVTRHGVWISNWIYWTFTNLHSFHFIIHNISPFTVIQCKLLTVALCYKLEVRSSILNKVMGIFNWANTSSRTTAPGSTQPLKEISTRNLRGGGGKGGQRIRRKTSLPSVSQWGSLNVSQPYGLPQPGTGIASHLWNLNSPDDGV